MKMFTEYIGDSRDLKNLYRLSVVSLGITTQARLIGWTISLPPSFKVKTLMRVGAKKVTQSQKVKWEFLTPNQQITYYQETYLPTIVCAYGQMVYVAFELNKRGMVHAHCLFYDSGIQNEYALTNLRAMVRQEYLCMQMVGSNMTKHMALNHIHFLDKGVDPWIEYLMKDIEKNNYPLLKYNGV
jgi:hypothetical protein